ncbi:hypothetical protein [Hyphomicrobium sp. MC8b]|uniref:hypothetical protein n=1 Tax=Hyphomicrobium sp. MC8b TaxID=300273 RepID=UPI003919C90C
MRYVLFLVISVFVLIGAGLAHALEAEKREAVALRDLGEVIIVEDDGKGVLLVFLGGLKVARCGSVEEKFVCEALSSKAEILPAVAGQPAPESGGGR